jgi:PAS domain S-box-containing protein
VIPMIDQGVDQSIFKRILYRAIVLPIVSLAVLSGLFLWQIDRLLNVTAWVEHTDQVISGSYNIQKLLVDMETGLRGYLLTGDKTFLDPYQQALLNIDKTFEDHDKLVADNPQQSERLKGIKSNYKEWRQYAIEMVSLRERGDAYQSVDFNIKGKQMMDALRIQLSDFIKIEENLRYERSLKVRRLARNVVIGGLFSTLLLGSILSYFSKKQITFLNQSYGQVIKESTDRTEALKRSEERFRLLVEEVKDYAIFMLDTEGRIVSWNEGAERIKGYKAQEIIGQHFSNFYTKEDQENGRPQRGLKIATMEGRFEDEGWRVRKDGSNFWADVVITAIRNRSGNLIGFAKVTRDFTERKQAEDEIRHLNESLEHRVQERTRQLEEANKDMEAFTYTVAHDLRAPLRAISGFSRALLEDYAERLDQEGKEYIESVIESAHRMDILLQDLLAYSRLSRAEIKMNLINLDNVVNQAIKQLEGEIQIKQASINIDGDLPAVMGHAPTLIQVVVNMLSNAIKFVPEGVQPLVKLETEIVRPGWIRLSVIDNGIGIDPEHHERIFNVFERLHGIESFPGTGIGLAIVRRGVERIGGHVGVESNPGQGSKFWIELQLAEQDDGR